MLPLSRASQYAIRSMAYLASRPGDEYVLTESIARELDLPRAFLAKVLGQLSSHGHVQTRRGRTGGVRLSRPADQISLHDVVTSCEPLSLDVPCALGQRRCEDAVACPLHDSWSRLWAQAVNALREMTLVDLLEHCASHPACIFPLSRATPDGRGVLFPGPAEPLPEPSPPDA